MILTPIAAVVLLLALFFYRKLVRSPWFTAFVNGFWPEPDATENLREARRIGVAEVLESSRRIEEERAKRAELARELKPKKRSK
jgi:hypothetical protein